MDDRFFRFKIFNQFPEVRHGISKRHYGNMKMRQKNVEETIANRMAFCEDLKIALSDCVFAGLVHGNKVTTCDESDRGKGAENSSTAIAYTDGLITNTLGVYLEITVADCLPIMIYDPINKIIGICHAGWRGIASGLILSMVEKFILSGSNPENLLVGVGPCICQKHFVVKKDVMDIFLEKYPQATLLRNRDGYVDLKKAAGADLIKKKIPQQNIEISHLCTVCDNGTYSSYRKENDQAPMMAAIIGLKK